MTTDEQRHSVTAEKPREWFITTEFFSNGGKVYDGWGPLGTRELALRVRALVEQRERRSDLFIDSRAVRRG